MGKDVNGKDVEVFVEYVLYKEKEFFFIDLDKQLNMIIGDIIKNVDGDKILGGIFWYGIKVLDEVGNDVIQFNLNFISLVKFDDKFNKYEFFNSEIG